MCWVGLIELWKFRLRCFELDAFVVATKHSGRLLVDVNVATLHAATVNEMGEERQRDDFLHPLVPIDDAER
jgi:hypothetical protein